MVHQVIQQPLIVHIGLVLLLLWIASLLHFNSSFIFLVAFVFLYEADRIYIEKTRRRLRYEERRSAYRRQLPSDSETLEWLNLVIKMIWPIFGQAFSQELLMSLFAWLLDKYKPWTAKKAVLQQLNLGKDPPCFKSIHVVSHSADNDDLVMDLEMNFTAAHNMSAVLAVQMRRRLGFGFWTTIHISKVQLEGKVRIGAKFSPTWPFLSCVRICFENVPSVQMTARPLSHHGVDVSEFPGIAGWMDRMMADALEQSLVEPNMLVIDVSKLISSMMSKRSSQSTSPHTGNWFDTYENPPIANVRLEILEAADLKPSDLNGMADPFVKGFLAIYKFKTKIQKKTLTPKWQEEFLIPITSWDLPDSLALNVLDKDQFHNDWLGSCRVSITKFRDGQRHDIWLPLDGVKTGKIHIAITVIETKGNFKHDATNTQENTEAGTETAIPHQTPGSIAHVEVPEPYAELVPEIHDEEDEFEAINWEKSHLGTMSIMRPGISRNILNPRRRMHRIPEREDSGNVIFNPVLANTDLHALEHGSSSTEDEHDFSRTDLGKKRHWGFHIPHSTSPKNTESDTLPPRNANSRKRTHLKIIKSRQAPDIAEAEGRADTGVALVGQKGTPIRTKVEPTHQVVEHGYEHSPYISTASQEIPDCLFDSPSEKKSMKMMTKNLFKHAGKKAHDIGHALVRKNSGHTNSSGQTEDGNLASPVEITKDGNQSSDENLFKHAGRKFQDMGHDMARKYSGHQSPSRKTKDGHLASIEFRNDGNQLSDDNLCLDSDVNLFKCASKPAQDVGHAVVREISNHQNSPRQIEDRSPASSSQFKKDVHQLSDKNLLSMSHKSLFKHADKQAQDQGHVLTTKGSGHRISYEQMEGGNLASSCKIAKDGNNLFDSPASPRSSSSST